MLLAAQYSAGGVYSKSSTLMFNRKYQFQLKLRAVSRWRDLWVQNITPLHWKLQLHSKHCCKGWGRVSGKFIQSTLPGCNVMDSNNATEYGGAVYVKDSDPISYCFSDTVEPLLKDSPY